MNFQKILNSITVFIAMSTGCMSGVRMPKVATVDPVPPIITFHADTSFTTQERTCIQKAAANWSSQTSGLANISFIWDLESSSVKSVRKHASSDRLVKWSATHQMVMELESESLDNCLSEGNNPEACKESHVLGLTSPSGGIHYVQNSPGSRYPVEVRLIADRIGTDDFCVQTAMHEFGHALGLPHIERSPQNIMWPSVVKNREACLKSDDLLYFCFRNNCGNVPTHPCAYVGPSESSP